MRRQEQRVHGGVPYPGVSAPSWAMLQIAPATRADVPLLLRFIRELAEYERLSHVVTATEPLLLEQLFGDVPRAEAVIARDGEAPVGFALFFHNFSTFVGRHGLHLEDLYVPPTHRGRGVGRALLQHLAALAAQPR
jgi:GNAT superfamily N-acetyltransferase